MLDLDDKDLTFLADFLPEGAIPVEFVVAIKFFNPEGDPVFKTWTPSDSSVDQVLGLLEVAKTRFLVDSGALSLWMDED